MKKNLLKWSLLAFMLVSNLVVFAQTTPVEPQPDVEGTDPLGTPIDSSLIYLAVIGVVFAVYYFSKMQKQKLQA